MERLCAAVGGFREYEDLLAAQHHQIVPEMRAATGALINPNTFMRFMVSVVNPLMMPPVHFTYDELGERRVRITATLRPDARPGNRTGARMRGKHRRAPHHALTP